MSRTVSRSARAASTSFSVPRISEHRAEAVAEAGYAR
jgi:hypothetical protein